MTLGDIYITFINLKRSLERRVFMEEQLKRINIPFEILDATDGRANPVQTTNPRSLTPQELGCADSHIRAMKNFLESGRPFALIMEDDIAIDPAFPSALISSLSSIKPELPQYVQFDYTPVGLKGVRLWWFLFGNLVQRDKTKLSFWLKLPFYLCKGLLANTFILIEGLQDFIHKKNRTHTLRPARKDHYLAGCYLITRHTAEILLKLNTPIQHAADAVHNIARRRGLISHCISVPRIIRQRRETFLSTLNPELHKKHSNKACINY